MNKKNVVWLAYVSYPVTTAVYFERALRKDNQVITVGPKLPDELITNWQLENMRLPIKSHNIDTDFNPDIEQIVKNIDKQYSPDLFLWIESVYGYFPKNISSLKIPKACYFIDSHINIQWQLEWAKNFDYVFIAQIEYLQVFKNANVQNVFWLPLGCDPEIHNKKSDRKLFDIGFVGSISGNEHERRRHLLNKINSITNVAYKRCFWEEMSEFFSNSKIVFNNAIRNDLNMRLFEVMSTGSLLLTDLAENSGQAEMFKDGEDLVIYSDDDILEKVTYYLTNDNLRNKIALRGQQLVHNAHTYLDRVNELLEVCLNGKSSTPDPVEWRDRSLKILSVNYSKIPVKKSQSKRSFVIPVLDMSPASPYNIVKLLDDLSNIDGEVIIIFNSLDMAEKLKDHPRIDYYAVMSENVGVSRAWNIGLNISDTQVTFILNSDLHIEQETVLNLEKYLLELEDAAIVGPQGSYFHYESATDLQYFDKGSFNYPFEVDAVSGFFFAVKTELFNSGTLKFDNQYTPCYFEEWDLGLQIKLAKLKSYIVPETGYEHEWSGSIRALRKIRYMKKEETAGEILERNRKLFWNKWNKKCNESQDIQQIFISKYVNFLGQKAEKLIQFKLFEDAKKVFNKLLEIYPNEIQILEKLGTLEYNNGNYAEAIDLLNKVAELDPNHKISTSNFNDSPFNTDRTKKNMLVCIVTSENTWQNMKSYCFNSNFLDMRNCFHLAVILNGDSLEAEEYIQGINPEYFWKRPNKGLDLAGFDYIIKHTPEFEYYMFLHDDHWFVDNKWFERLFNLIQKSPDVDVWGNLVPTTTYKPQNYDMICETLGYNEYKLDKYPFFLQGLAGLFKGNVIQKLLCEMDGVPHIHTTDQNMAQVLERIFSLMLMSLGFNLGQIPPGYEEYLKHRNYEKPKL